MNVIGYLRVSTQEQAINGAGLDAQRRAIADEAERRGWSVRWVTDPGYTAANLNRPGITEALTLLDGREAEALVVAKLDRLSRSLHDFAGLVERSRRRGWAVVALDVNVDTTTPEGEVLSGVLALFAQYERRLIGRRVKDALAIKRAQGVRLGMPPRLPAETRAAIRRHRRAGRTYQRIADRLNADGMLAANGGQWRRQQVRNADKAVA